MCLDVGCEDLDVDTSKGLGDFETKGLSDCRNEDIADT
jgi:hypothetical protein